MQDELKLQDASLELLRAIAAGQKGIEEKLTLLEQLGRICVEQSAQARVLAGYSLQQSAQLADFILPKPVVPDYVIEVDRQIEELIANGLPNDPEVIRVTRERLLQEAFDRQEEPQVAEGEGEEDSLSGALSRLEELQNEPEQG
jgi:hypothetical protein